jgi:hypoxanthine-DNA glycosylase
MSSSKFSLHPYESFIPESATSLIIGSMPPYRFCHSTVPLKKQDVNFFYGSQDNHFWKLLEEIYDEQFSYENTAEAIAKRKELLKKYHLGIADIVKKCQHEGGKSSDEDLKEIQYRDIPTLLQNHPQIDTLIYTSDFVKSHFYKAFGISHNKTNQDKVFTIKLNDKSYTVKVLYSPSPTALRGLGKDGQQKRRQQYQSFLKGECDLVFSQETLRVTTIQTDLYWEDSVANRAMLEKKIRALEETDVIILPEMFTTGFSMNAKELAETMSGVTVSWMKQLSKEFSVVLTGSVIIKEGNHYFNRMLWVQPAGELLYYDKKHLFSMAKEEETYTAGTQRIMVDYKGWKIALFVCYDLRFPAWCRNQKEYDMAIYVASWPAKRSYHWCTLLPARAIENQAYVFGVNRIGKDGKGFDYNGDTMVIDPAGEIWYHQEEKEHIQQHILTKEHLMTVRKQYPFLQDRDTFRID